MEKIELINMFVSRSINPSIPELMEYHQWICSNPSEEEQKKQLLTTYLANNIAITASEMKKVYKWLYSDSAEQSVKADSDDMTIETFIKRLKYDIFDDCPSIFTRASKWIISKDFKNVLELISFGSEQMSKEFNIGQSSVNVVSSNLKKYYGIEKW